MKKNVKFECPTAYCPLGRKKLELMDMCRHLAENHPGYLEGKIHPNSLDQLDRALSPPLSLLVCLGSIAVHIEEFLSKDGHPFDREAIKSLLSNPELRSWIKVMDEKAFLPKKRKE